MELLVLIESAGTSEEILEGFYMKVLAGALCWNPQVWAGLCEKTSLSVEFLFYSRLSSPQCHCVTVVRTEEERNKAIKVIHNVIGDVTKPNAGSILPYR